MLYLLDANVLITAHNQYYPLDQVPEFWSWLSFQAASGRIKIPLENLEEVLDGKKEGDLLLDWLREPEHESNLRLGETVSPALVQKVATDCYAPDLTDDEVDKIGRDPFLIAYALAQPAERCVVTTEVSRPSAQRQNRKIPDVCRDLSIECCGPFVLNRRLGFRTGWHRS